MFENLMNFLFGGNPVWGGVAAAVVFFFVLFLLKTFIRVAFPNSVLVVTGRTKKRAGKKFGFTIERGRTLSAPYIQDVTSLDLGVIPINVRVDGVNSANGIAVGADATALVCIDDDDEGMLYTAVERLMGKSREEIKEQIQQTLIGNFRGALNKTTPLQAIGMEEVVHDESNKALDAQGERAIFRHELLMDIDSDLSSFGMKVVSVSLQKIWDTSNYIANLAEKTLATKRQEVEIEEARLEALAKQAESNSVRIIAVAKNKADEAIIAETQKVEVFRRKADGQIKQARLEAENKAIEAENKGQKLVQEKLIELKRLENQTGTILVAKANQKAAKIMAQGEQEAVNIREEARNSLFKQKVDLLTEAGDGGKMILFIQQQLPHLFNSYQRYAKNQEVDSYVVMDDENGFSQAVNRGPEAFVNFLKHFEDGLGVNIKDLLSTASQNQEVTA